MNRILIIDDDIEVCKKLKYHMLKSEVDIYYATSPQDGMAHLMSEEYTLLILDVNLFETDGIALLQQIRKMQTLPIIAMSSKADLRQKAHVISLGADDLMLPPQGADDLEDCMLRTLALMRRYTDLNAINQPTYSIVSRHGLLMDTQQRTASFFGRPLNLTRKEFDMLQLLASSPGRVYTYEQIFGQVWDTDYVGSPNTLAKHISRLRKKEPGLEIEAVHNLGYRLKKQEL